MVIGHRRSPISPSKLTKIVSLHEQMRISYQQLKSQIDTGLAEEVFASLSIPLMKLAEAKNDQTPSGDKFKLKLAGAAACAAPSATNFDVGSPSWGDLKPAPSQSAMAVTDLGHEPC
uniref:Uncharacterized protein n=1 Tax=Salix viminalis TaxID=40686 RepID=A0A6N2M7Y2_SALVM